MHSRFVPRLIPTLFLVLAMFPLHAQVRPAATQGGIPVVVGIGGADYSIDWGPGKRMEGITAWADYYPWGMPPKIHGLGAEVEGRDLNFNRPSGLSKMRQDTALAGPVYQFSHWKNFRPVGKFLLGIGSIDFPANPKFPYYTHDTFFVTAAAGGMDVRVWHHMWARGDYEYQWWHHTFGPNDLNPNGASFGLVYDFRPTPNE